MNLTKFIGTIILVTTLGSCTSSIDLNKRKKSVVWDTIAGPSQGVLLQTNELVSAYIPNRPLQVWLPSTYDAKRKHAVLYMYDGQMLFDAAKAWNHKEWRVDEVVDSLLELKEILPTIVVALHNGGQQRNFEYFPQKPHNELNASFSDSMMADIAKHYGSDSVFRVKSDDYLSYIVVEVMPVINESFNVYEDKSATVIAGSSMGGLMSMYAIGEYPDVFGSAICMSTHWPGGYAPNEDVPEAFQSYIAANIKQDKVGKIYFDYGTETLDEMYEPFQMQVDSILEWNGFHKDVNWRTQKFQGAAHDELSWAKRLHIPLLFMLKKQR